MFDICKKFTTDENGAVTVDWVVLTAAVVGFGGLMYVLLNEGVQDLDGDVGNALASHEVQDINF
ncbi:hypothetical protein [Ruegeria sp.]|uniref:hypothetical protein n=1 Tax=Ruegeria sp. TaxID=1879320 RepID=UPI003C7EBC99